MRLSTRNNKVGHTGESPQLFCCLASEVLTVTLPFFYSHSNLVQMSTQSEKPCTTGKTMTAEELTKHLTEAFTPIQHREHLHHMMVGWLKSEQKEHHPEYQEQIYLTYLLLCQMFDKMDGK